MRRFAVLVFSLLTAACGGAGSPGRIDSSQASALTAPLDAQGVGAHSRVPRFGAVLWNDYAVPGERTLIVVSSTDPAFLENRACEGGPRPDVGDDWSYLNVQDVSPRAGKQSSRQWGSLFTRVYEATLLADFDAVYCDLIHDGSGTLLAEGTAKFDVTDLNSCTANETIAWLGGGILATTPDFPCESGKARLDYAFRYAMSNDATFDAECTLTAGEVSIKQADGPTLTCIGR